METVGIHASRTRTGGKDAEQQSTSTSSSMSVSSSSESETEVNVRLSKHTKQPPSKQNKPENDVVAVAVAVADGTKYRTKTNDSERASSENITLMTMSNTSEHNIATRTIPSPNDASYRNSSSLLVSTNTKPPHISNQHAVAQAAASAQSSTSTRIALPPKTHKPTPTPASLHSHPPHTATISHALHSKPHILSRKLQASRTSLTVYPFGALTAEAREPSRKQRLLTQLHRARKLRSTLEAAAATLTLQHTPTVAVTNPVALTPLQPHGKITPQLHRKQQALELLRSHRFVVNELVTLTEAVKGGYTLDSYDGYTQEEAREDLERKVEVEKSRAIVAEQLRLFVAERASSSKEGEVDEDVKVSAVLLPERGVEGKEEAHRMPTLPLPLPLKLPPPPPQSSVIGPYMDFIGRTSPTPTPPAAAAAATTEREPLSDDAPEHDEENGTQTSDDYDQDEEYDDGHERQEEDNTDSPLELDNGDIESSSEDGYEVLSSLSSVNKRMHTHRGPTVEAASASQPIKRDRRTHDYASPTQHNTNHNHNQNHSTHSSERSHRKRERKSWSNNTATSSSSSVRVSVSMKRQKIISDEEEYEASVSSKQPSHTPKHSSSRSTNPSKKQLSSSQTSTLAPSSPKHTPTEHAKTTTHSPPVKTTTTSHATSASTSRRRSKSKKKTSATSRKCHDCKGVVTHYLRCHFWFMNGTKCGKIYCKLCLEAKYDLSDKVSSASDKLSKAHLSSDVAHNNDGAVNDVLPTSTFETLVDNDEWHCPSCLNTCLCTVCVKERERNERRKASIEKRRKSRSSHNDDGFYAAF